MQRGMCTEKNKTQSQLGAEKIAFPPKPDIRTDISSYRVASQLKIIDNKVFNLKGQDFLSQESDLI